MRCRTFGNVHRSSISLKLNAHRDCARPVKGSGKSSKHATLKIVNAARNAQEVVLVTGANGRTGQQVVTQLLAQGAGVKAVVRTTTKPEEVAAIEELAAEGDQLEVVGVKDLSDEAEVKEACQEVQAVVWCAQGDGKPEPMPQKVQKGLSTLARVVKMRLNLPTGDAKQDEQRAAAQDDGVLGGLDHCAAVMAENGGRLVLLSSAAVTRSAWSPEKQAALELCVDIPIVRLNPFGVLDSTRLAEQRLRESGAQYAIVRPVGLRDTEGPKSWPRGRPWISQGDVAVGRANREDVAGVLVSACFSESAMNKTFEMLTLAGDSYPPPADGLDAVFGRLQTDQERAEMREDMGFGDGDPSGPGEAAVRAQYGLAMQMLPGEAQEPTKLEMGRTYEEVDQGKVNRKKGAAATAREVALAARGEQRQSGTRT
ncbi:hypothetical protein CYMTET_40721 [Cymbomonas tetramitiformis]|uniref:NAD(P)-binding domain-containing protein n=1 Tax=Cymbomonas tetramitiformis TaxID=36881 RepID=A0AAE0C7I6_9CHLO|nr:hypothetical protein CYMTET_40721 [Cymbomonas tetramitiformis]